MEMKENENRTDGKGGLWIYIYFKIYIVINT